MFPAVILVVLAACGRAPGPTAEPPASSTDASPSASIVQHADVILVETQSRRTDVASSCTTQGEFAVRLVMDRSTTPIFRGIGLDPNQTPGYEDGFPPIVWPFGFTATVAQPAQILDENGSVVAVEGQVIRLAGGSIDERGYHVCLVNGKMYLGKTAGG